MNESDTPPGDAPVSPTEERLGQFVADALDRLQRGDAVVVEDLLADRPDLIGHGRELVRDLAAFPSAALPVEASLPQPFPKDYLVTRLLGEGSYGRVWLAEDLHLPRQVALKTLRVPPGSDVGAAALVALRREAGFLVGISHPNVVRVYGWRQSGDDHYLVLEYVPGGSLDALVAGNGSLPWDRAGRYVADVAAGLLEAHDKGVVHRDIKPANILLDTGPDEAKLTDFGVAGRLTDVGMVIGTTRYMAPEAFLGRATTASDVYGLAVTLFRLVAGDVPFRGATREEQVRLIESGLPDPDPRLADLPESLEHVVRAGLAANADHRPPLRVFMAQLRGGFNQSLVDGLAGLSSAGVGLHLGVSREVGADRWQTVAATRPRVGGLQRNMRRVPREPDRVRVRTGEWVRVEVTSERDGFVTVFNVGPTGDLNVLYPDRPVAASSPPHIRAGQPLLIPDVVFEPPSGRERVFAVWSAAPLLLADHDLRDLAEGGTGARSYRVSRCLRRMKDAVESIGPANCHVSVLELTHDAAG